MGDPARIYLQPACCASPGEGRLWCDDNVWPTDSDCDKPGIEYVRADLSEWQDISTAPKDGTRILLWTSTEIDEDDRWYVEEVCEGEHVILAQVGFYDREWVMEKIGAPTHWMPLPDPPQGQEP